MAESEHHNSSEAWYSGVSIESCPNCEESMNFDAGGNGDLHFWCQSCGHEYDRNVTRDDLASRRNQLERMTTLSDREAEVVAFKEAGATHAQIADEMGIEKGTVDSHAHRARVKYNLAVTTVQELEGQYE